MSKKDRQDWLKDNLAMTGMLVVGDNELIDTFTLLFPEAEKSRIYYAYGVHPCPMMRNDCRELYKRGEFGKRLVVGSGFGSRGLGLGSHGVAYVLFQCYKCKKKLDDGEHYRYGTMQVCKECFEKELGK